MQDYFHEYCDCKYQYYEKAFILLFSQQTGNLEIYDTKGLLLKKLKTENLEQQLDISDLKAGAYLYRFMMEDGLKYGKIVKE